MTIVIPCGRCAADVPLVSLSRVFGPRNDPDAVRGFDARGHYLTWQRTIVKES